MLEKDHVRVEVIGRAHFELLTLRLFVGGLLTIVPMLTKRLCSVVRGGLLHLPEYLSKVEVKHGIDVGLGSQRASDLGFHADRLLGRNVLHRAGHRFFTMNLGRKLFQKHELVINLCFPLFK